MSDPQTLCSALCNLWTLPRGKAIALIKTFTPKLQAVCYRFEGDMKLILELAKIEPADFFRQGLSPSVQSDQFPIHYAACAQSLDCADLKTVIASVKADAINVQHFVMLNWIVHHFFHSYKY